MQQWKEPRMSRMDFIKGIVRDVSKKARREAEEKTKEREQCHQQQRPVRTPPLSGAVGLISTTPTR